MKGAGEWVRWTRYMDIGRLVGSCVAGSALTGIMPRPHVNLVRSRPGSALALTERRYVDQHLKYR